MFLVFSQIYPSFFAGFNGRCQVPQPLNYTLSFQHEVATDAKLPATRLPANVTWQSCWLCLEFRGIHDFWLFFDGKSKKMQRFQPIFFGDLGWAGSEMSHFATEFLVLRLRKPEIGWSVGQVAVEVPVPSNLSQAGRGNGKKPSRGFQGPLGRR